MRVAQLIYLVVVASLACSVQGGGYKNTLVKNLAIGLAQKWIVQRCFDQHSRFQLENKVFIKGLDGRVHQVADFGVTNNRKLLEEVARVEMAEGRKLLETITAAELEEKMRKRRADRLRHEKEANANKTRLHAWAVEHDYEDYFKAASITEHYCTNSTNDRGPHVLNRDMPDKVMEYMLTEHKELGGCDVDKGECGKKTEAAPAPMSPEGPEAFGGNAVYQQIAAGDCPPINDSTDLVTVFLSLLVGVGIGIAGTMYVAR
mmetsp:Transcript_39350/g.66079  ORF Transcript_39350/g.66079 Transcript_39350/m.66079 type:complete len:260 (-) Transcript_39350:68-847(-)